MNLWDIQRVLFNYLKDCSGPNQHPNRALRLVSMDISKFLIVLVMLFVLDCGIAISFYLLWFKKKSFSKINLNSFPYTATRKQLFLWCVCWIFVVFLNIPVYAFVSCVLASFLEPTNGLLYVTAFFVAIIGYSFLAFIAYTFTKLIMDRKTSSTNDDVAKN